MYQSCTVRSLRKSYYLYTNRIISSIQFTTAMWRVAHLSNNCLPLAVHKGPWWLLGSTIFWFPVPSFHLRQARITNMVIRWHMVNGCLLSWFRERLPVVVATAIFSRTHVTIVLKEYIFKSLWLLKKIHICSYLLKHIYDVQAWKKSKSLY